MSQPVSSRPYVVDVVMLPQARMEYAIDLNGDGKADNQLGNIVGAFTAQSLNLQHVVDRSLALGLFVLPITVHASLPPNERTVAVTFGGGASSAHFCVEQEGTAFFSTDPVTFTFEWPFADGPTTMAGASVSVGVDHQGTISGRFNAGIPGAEIGPRLLAAFTDVVNRELFEDAASPLDNWIILSTLDTGGEDQGCAGSCRNDDGSCGVRGNKYIEDCEVSTNSITKNVFAPDVQLFRDGQYAPSPDNKTKDSISIGLGFTAQAVRP
jgi:hypothetical protein